jgi:hypothetical protein
MDKLVYLEEEENLTNISLLSYPLHPELERHGHLGHSVKHWWHVNFLVIREHILLERIRSNTWWAWSKDSDPPAQEQCLN